MIAFRNSSGKKRQVFITTSRSGNCPQISAKFSVGQLITTIGNVANGTQETVNAVVTGVAFDLVSGSTRVTTDFPDWDFTQV